MSKRENIGLWIGLIATIIPALIVAGFFPEFNVLPAWGWLAIATIGSMVAGGIATNRMIPGMLTGGIAGLGLMIGVIGYISIRTAIFQSENFLRLEIAIGALVGAAPGLISWLRYARQDSNRRDAGSRSADS